MKNSSIHAILSDVHRLLSQYSPDDFEAASRYSGVSDSIRSALLALAGKPGLSSQQTPHEFSRREGLQQNLPGRRRVPVRQALTRDRILEAILKSPLFSDSRAILNYASAHGFAVRAKPKDGKERLARRLAAAMESVPDAMQADMLSDLGWDKGSQTQGWIDVIKGART